MVDPRPGVINQRLERIGKIVAVSSGKGGVGKSVVATTLALALAQEGFRVGLFDIDFTSPSTHVILGAKSVHPTEKKGLVPSKVQGLAYMSIIYFSGDYAVPLRGAETSNALIELLAVTQWGELDFLIIDMPPGIGDAVLDLIRLVKHANFLIVTTSSKLAFETVKKQVMLLKDLKVPVIGIIENMKMTDSKNIQQQTGSLNVKFLAEIPFDPQIESAIGDGARLLSTLVGRRVKEIVKEKAFDSQ